MDYCDIYNDRALTFQVINTEKTRPFSKLGRMYDSRCNNMAGQKKTNCMQEVDIMSDGYDNSFYYNVRSERPPGLQEMLVRKNLQFITEDDLF